MENQMSTVAAGNVLLTHWAYMHQCKHGDACFSALPGVIPEFLGQPNRPFYRNYLPSVLRLKDANIQRKTHRRTEAPCYCIPFSRRCSSAYSRLPG
jgi:hypothetical protein